MSNDKVVLTSGVIDADGHPFVSDDILKGKVVALLFGSSWSPPCCDFVGKLAHIYRRAKAESLE